MAVWTVSPGSDVALYVGIEAIRSQVEFSAFVTSLSSVGSQRGREYRQGGHHAFSGAGLEDLSKLHMGTFTSSH